MTGKSDINVRCPVPDCSYETGTTSQMIAAALLSAHATVHSALSHHQPPPQVPKLDRPQLDIGVAAEEWNLFESRWRLYARSSNITRQNYAVQLFQCASKELGDAILRLDNNISEKSEDELLATMKSLAVIPVATMVLRAELFAMKQNRDEVFRSFFARVRGKADICSYSVHQKCQCGRSNEVDFTEIMIRDVVIAGIYDEDIKRRIMGIQGLCDKSANDIVSLVEAEEMARDSVPQMHHTATISDQKKPKKPLIHSQGERQQKIPCPQCQKPFYQYKKGRFGWNKSPHTMCTDCFRQTISSKRSSAEKSSTSTPSLSQISAISTCSTSHQQGNRTTLQEPYEVAPLQLSHHIFSKGEWKKVNFKKHPQVNLTMSVDHGHYRSFGVRSPAVPDMSVTCIADSGAQSNVWSLQECKRMGFTEHDLIPVNTSLSAANKSSIEITGAIIVTLSGEKVDGSTISCPAMVYISPSVNAFYLCHESMIDLGILPHSFPSVGDAFFQQNSALQYDDAQIAATATSQCSCPKRQAVPPRPSKLPFDCKPENIDNMRKWLLDTFASSTFNTCPHQHLPVMKGPPIEMHLDPNAIPRVCHTAAPVPLHWQKKVKSDLERDVALGVLEEVPYGEPVSWCHRMVITRKHDGNPRRTVDLSPLNKFCKRETFASESPFHLARKIPGGTWKTVTDAWNGYHSVPLRDSDKHLTTFITPFGRFRYIRAPQGFVSSGDGYNRRFDAILADFMRKERCVDDTVHYDEDLQDHWWRTIDFLRKVGEAGIVLNPQKFNFCKKDVEFAGFRVGESVIEPLPKYLDAIRDFPTPKNITDIRSWFGLVNQVANYAQLREIMAPFRPFLSPKHPFQWSQELEESFQRSKEEIVKAITKGVEIFDITRKTCLRPDWSRQGIGYFLLQKHCDCTSNLPDCCTNGWKIVLAGSRFLSSAEQRYAPIEGEALAVAWGLEQSKYFTQGCEDLVVVTDHKPLVKILGDRTLDEITNTRLFRLKQRTLPWRFIIAHLPGKTNYAADATSRNPSPRINDYSDEVSHSMRSSDDEVEACHVSTISDDVTSAFALSWSKIKSATAADAVLDRLLYHVENGFPETRDNLPSDLAAYWNYRDALYVHDGVLMYSDRIVVPTSLRQTVVNLLHSAHQGVSMMESRARSIVFWPRMSEDIKRVRDACLHCCRNAPSQAATPAMAPTIPSSPFECIVADYFESHGHHYLAVADRLSGWVEVFSSPSKSINFSATGLLEHLRNVFKVFGVPVELASDGGPQFRASSTEKFLAKWGVKHRISSAYFPQSNGRAEVAVKTAKRLLHDNIGPSGSLDNDKFLRAMLQLRNTPDPDCNLSPAEIVFGRPIRDAFSFINRMEKFKNPSVRPMWREAWRAKETALRTRFTRNTERLNASARDLVPLEAGQRVFVQNQTGSHPTKWDRSGVIMEPQGHDQYLVKIDGSGRLTLRNRRFLRMYTTASPVISGPNASPLLPPTRVVDEQRRTEQSTPTHPTRELSIVPPIDTAQVPIDPPAVPVDLPAVPMDLPAVPMNLPAVPIALTAAPVDPAPTAHPEPAHPSVGRSVEPPSTPQHQPLQPMQPTSNQRPRRERKPRKFYDAHSGTWK